MALRWSVVCLGFSRRRRSLDKLRQLCTPVNGWSIWGRLQRRVEGINISHLEHSLDVLVRV